MYEKCTNFDVQILISTTNKNALLKHSSLQVLQSCMFRHHGDILTDSVKNIYTYFTPSIEGFIY